MDEENAIDADLLQAERERVQRLLALQRVAFGIIAKWFWLLTLVFVGLSALFSVYFVWRAARSGHRFAATTRLLYSPRQVAKIDNFSDKQLLSVLDRKSLKRRVAEKLEMPLEERECLSKDLSVHQERKPTNLFTLTAEAPTWIGVVKKVNAYAEVLIEEYVSYRKRALENWHAGLLVRKKNLQNLIAEVDSEEAIEKGKAGIASPSEALVTLNALISDQRRNYSLLNVQVASEELKRKKLEEIVGSGGKAVLANASQIRQKSAELAEIDAELARLREIYTDINPKVLGKMEDRKKCLAEFAEIFRANGIEGVSLENIAEIEKAAGELAETSLKLEVLAESQKSLMQEILANERRSGVLTSVIPVLERLRVKRAGLEEQMRGFDEQISDIEFMQMSIADDLQQIERSMGAEDRNPLGFKNFALAIGGAGICTSTVLFWILFLEFMFGRVRGAEELAATGDIVVVGSLPAPGLFQDEHERDILGFVALCYCSCELPKNVVLVCRLPGVPIQKRFRDVLEWSLTMAGTRAFTLKIVSSSGFEPHEGAETLINTVKEGSKGWFPVANRFMLAPTELQMLQADLATLSADFDEIYIFMPGGLQRGGSFFSQLLGVSTCALVLAQANHTPRSELAYVRRHVRESGKPMIGIVTGASIAAARKEMEAHK
ncbi:MAG: hypothetical protein IJJ51_02480 [Kiritimatiellae bacterium]|nr:hypothetical protein [Kiritimatiellia bacterium]